MASETQNIIDITGQRSGRLLILTQLFPYRDKRGNYKTPKWLCQCDCGNTTTVAKGSLVSGCTKSCGCLVSETNRKRIPAVNKARALPSGQAARNAVLRRYKAAALENGRAWSLTEHDFDAIIRNKCHYCGVGPSNERNAAGGTFKYNGIDRKDNSRGYEKDNVVPCCIICNRAKNTISYGTFVNWITAVRKASWPATL